MLEDLRHRIEKIQPELRVVERGDVVHIVGVFLLTDDSSVVDRYHIDLELPRNHPRGIPSLWEVGGRIPWESDRHVDKNNDGKACLFVPDEYCYRFPDGMDAVAFLNGPVLGFFAGQSLVEAGEQWPFGIRDHAGPGIIQFYAALVGSSDRATIIRYLEAVIRKKLSGHLQCPCGSGKNIRDCLHRQLLERLRNRIPRAVAQQSLTKLLEEARRK